MLQSVINFKAVAAATIASFLFGGVWYGLLGQRWMAALGKSEAELKAAGRPMTLLFGLTIAAETAVALMLAGLLAHLGYLTPFGGALSAVLLWAGLALPIHLVNYSYQGTPWSLALIDSGHWLGVLLIQGIIIGWMGGG